MSDVSSIVRSSTPLQAAASRAAVDVASPVVSQATAPVQQEAAEIEVKDVKAAVAQINDYVQLVQRDLQFSVDDYLGATVVKVIDRNSGDVIRQIPNDVALDLARNLKDKMDIQLLEASG